PVTLGPVHTEGPERQTGASRSAARGQPVTTDSFGDPPRRRPSALVTGRAPGQNPWADPDACQRLLHRIRRSVCHLSCPPDCRFPPISTRDRNPLPSSSARAAVVDMGILQTAKAHVNPYFAIPRHVPRHFWFIPRTASVPHT